MGLPSPPCFHSYSRNNARRKHGPPRPRTRRGGACPRPPFSEVLQPLHFRAAPRGPLARAGHLPRASVAPCRRNRGARARRQCFAARPRAASSSWSSPSARARFLGLPQREGKEGGAWRGGLERGFSLGGFLAG